MAKPGTSVNSPRTPANDGVLATYCPPLATNNDGEIDAACALKGALAEPMFVTTTLTAPEIASGGVRTISWDGLIS